MRSVTRIHDIARAFLNAIAEYYAEENEELPARRAVTAGAPSWDCQLFGVWSSRTVSHEGNVAQTVVQPLIGAAGSALRVVEFGITIVRCAPMIDAEGDVLIWPTVEEEEAAALAVHRDEVLVQNAVRVKSRAGALASSNDWAFTEWRVIGPAGGFVASEHKILVSTDWDPPVVEDDETP